MRNLKRALSLALASVMLLGMMVVGTSAASYPDVDDNDNVEAIEVLNAVKVMIGDRGNFKPDAKVNRHEMAVIMAKLVLGNEIADKYVGTHPFTDVASWADKYVAACYENGIVAGTSRTTFSGDRPLTAVEAAAFMLRALGYKDLSKGASDWSVPVTAMANQIRLFSGVASNPKEELTRNQVAQLALNTLKSPVVDLKDNTFSVSEGQLVITGGSRDYIARSSSEAYAKAINDTEVAGTSASQIGGCTIELGEHLYNGKLKLNNDDIDDFGRPARTWTYDGNEIGSYGKTELLLASYTEGVTGRTVYDKLGQSTIRDNDLIDYVDGYVNGYNATGNLVKNDLVRSNSKNLSGTGRGVLTEVYLDNDKELITIVSIHTYLAKANSDYNTSSETVSMTVYNSNGGITKLVDKEDVPGIVDLKKDDWALVNWVDESSAAADKTVVNMMDVTINENVEVTGFASKTEDYSNWSAANDASRHVTDITTGGQTYKANEEAWYKENTLNNYNDNRLVDKTYTLYMDQYGNFIGAELYSGQDQYVFITGYDNIGSAIGMTTAKANAIFTDGTMRAIDVNVTDSNKNILAANLGYSKWTQDQNHEEMWYTYTVSNNVYTLTPVARWTRSFTSTADTIIDCSNVRLTPSTGSFTGTFDGVSGTYAPTYGSDVAAGARAYGEDASVYITVEMGDVTKDGTYGGPSKKGVTEVNGVYTGVQNVKLVYQPGAWAHAVVDSDRYIIACVVLGEAEGVVDNYAYIRDGAKNERVEKNTDGSYTHFWDVDVIMDGAKGTKVIKSKYSNTTSALRPGTVQELILDSDGYVTKINDLPNGTVVNGAENVDGTVGDKIYTNYDYTTNTSNVKPNSTDLVDYDVFDIDVDTTAIGTKGSYVDNGTTHYFTDLTLQGRTLKFDASSKDKGLPIMEGAKAVIRHYVNRDWEYTDCGSVAEAFALITDADYNGNNGKQFSGRVVAVLNDTGRAEWVFFDDETKPQNSDPNYTPSLTGERVSYNAGLADVNKLLAEGKDVIIDGDWYPYDLSATNKTLRLPRGRTLTVLGDFECFENNGADTIVITQFGSGSKLGKIVVGQATGSADVTTAKFSMYQDVDFDIDAQYMHVDHMSNKTGHIAFRTGTEVKVAKDLDLNWSIELDAYGTLTVGNDVVKGPNVGTPKVNVYGTTTINGDLKTSGTVYNAHTLIVKGAVDGAGVVVTVGDSTREGRAIIGDITSGAKVVVFNTSATNPTTVTKVTNGEVEVQNDAKVTVTTVDGATNSDAKVTVSGATASATIGTVTTGTVTTTGANASATVAVAEKDAKLTGTSGKIEVTGELNTSDTTGNVSAGEETEVNLFASNSGVVFICDETSWTNAYNNLSSTYNDTQKQAIMGGANWEAAKTNRTLPWIFVLLNPTDTTNGVWVKDVKVEKDGKEVQTYAGLEKDDEWEWSSACKGSYLHWEMVKSTDSNPKTLSLDQARSAIEGTYTVTVTLKVGGQNGTDTVDVSFTGTYKNPTNTPWLP